MSSSAVDKHNRHNNFYGLYAITDATAGLTPAALCNQVIAAIEGGARIIQYRQKNLSPTQQRQQAQALLECCRERATPLIINDDPALAAAIGADGVHLGQEDMPLPAARELLGERAIIGTSCYNSFGLATTAQQAGADYVAFGRFFASTTKPLAVEADPALLRQAKAALNIPVVAIGGITPINGKALVEAGADMLAAVNGVFARREIRVAAQQYAQLFE